MGCPSSRPDPDDLNNLENCRAYDKRLYVAYPPNPIREEAYTATERKRRDREAGARRGQSVGLEVVNKSGKI